MVGGCDACSSHGRFRTQGSLFSCELEMRITKIQWVSGVVSVCLAGSALAAPQVYGTLVPTTMIGDANGDGVANAKDLTIVQQNLNKPGGRAQGDFDGNGLVNTADLTLLNNNFQRRAPDAYFGKV